jgi:hypothetical protein
MDFVSIFPLTIIVHLKKEVKTPERGGGFKNEMEKVKELKKERIKRLYINPNIRIH